MDQIMQLIETIPYLLGLHLIDKEGIQILGHCTVQDNAVQLTEPFLLSIEALKIYDQPKYIISRFESFEIVQFYMDGIVLALVGQPNSQYELVKIGRQMEAFVSSIKKQIP
jgi:hypothetical protein